MNECCVSVCLRARDSSSRHLALLHFRIARFVSERAGGSSAIGIRGQTRRRAQAHERTNVPPLPLMMTSRRRRRRRRRRQRLHAWRLPLTRAQARVLLRVEMRKGAPTRLPGSLVMEEIGRALGEGVALFDPWMQRASDGPAAGALHGHRVVLLA